MGLIKSYGNYVIQRKHQLINDGTILERDYATVGGMTDNPTTNQQYYKRGTFVYSINGEIVTNKIYDSKSWEKNGESEFWNQENIDVNETQDNSLNILLKQDSYKLKDFAYFGSCAELIKNSLKNIINQFPGELYVPIIKENGKVVVENPFGINLHTPFNLLTIDEQNDLKNVHNNISNYDVVNANGEIYEVKGIEIVTKEKPANTCTYHFADAIVKYNDKNSITFECWCNENDNVYYQTNKSYEGFHIRPKTKLYNDFFKNLSSFEKVLLNKDSQPKYSAIFEVYKETDYGYQSFYEKFTFPITKSGYNLDIVSDKYTSYINALSKYAIMFDDLYCNNLYRQMTHESIKNFDWTDVLQRNNETKDDYVENGKKIEHMLMIFGKELDEIKFYIDGIKNTNTITYNDANNISNYFLTDTLNIEGWDVKNVFPLIEQNGNVFEDLTTIAQPYGNTKLIDYIDGYFSGYFGENNFTKIERVDVKDIHNEGAKNKIYQVDNNGYLRERIKQHISNKPYSMQNVNDNFFKYLKLNSRNIFQKKGTIEAIESLLGLFGLRSKRWYDSIEQDSQKRLVGNQITYDYEIKEYVAITTPLEEKDTSNEQVNLPRKKNLYDFFNTTKTLAYNTSEFKNGVYVPYQGLPVRYYEMNDKRYLYPYFSNNKIIDGKPYYQMNGGWCHKDYIYSANTVLDENDGGFLDTNTQISSVNDLRELLTLQDEQLYDGLIYHVKSIKGDYVCVNEKLYDIFTELDSMYFKVQVKNNMITIGDQEWYGSIETYDENGELCTIDIGAHSKRGYIKIFIKEDKELNNFIIHVAQEERILINYMLFIDGKMVQMFDADGFYKNVTNYFVLENKAWGHRLGLWGWNQLTQEDPRYISIQRIQRNYQGNNPHTKSFTYDNGVEYLMFFKQLFKYAIEQEAFNKNCYSTLQEYMASLCEIEDNVGFQNLIEDNLYYIDIKKYSDTKIHNFCNYLDTSGQKKYFYEFNDGGTIVDYDNASYNTSILDLPKNYQVNTILSLHCKEVLDNDKYAAPLSGSTVILWFNKDEKLGTNTFTYYRLSTNFGINNPIINAEIPSGECIVIEQERFYAENGKIKYKGHTYKIESDGGERFVTINNVKHIVLTSNAECFGIKVFLNGEYYKLDKKVRVQIIEIDGYDNYYSFYECQNYNNLNNDNVLSGTVVNNQTCLDQIINLKNVDIIFKNNATHKFLQRQYFDKIVLHYLLQIIPSNVILNIKFQN